MRPVFFYKPPPPPPDSNSGWRWWFGVWIPPAIAVAIICVESTDTFSSAHTSSWLRPLVQGIFGAMGDPRWELVHHLIRKTGHFIGYGTVGLTFLRAWLYTIARRGIGALRIWRIESTILAILSTALVASADEFHQSFIPSRTGMPSDVLLDSVGATAMCLLVWIVCWTRRAPGYNDLALSSESE